MADAERSEGTATTTTADPETTASDYDVAIVGDRPTSYLAGVFIGWYGLDTIAFDRGRSSLQRCAYLENYLGFPGDVNVETLYGLIHDHVEAAGYDLIPTLTEAIEPAGGDGTEAMDTAGPDFGITTQDGETVTVRRVAAVTRYGDDFPEPLDDDGMFVAYEYDGEIRTKFDRNYAGIEGRIAIDGLYVTTPVSEVNVQAIISARQDTHVGWSIITGHRLGRGYPEALVRHWDWMRPESEPTDGKTARDDWCERFDSRVPDDYDLTEGRPHELRKTDMERQHEVCISEGAIEARTKRGRERLTDHLGVAADSTSDSG